MPGNQARAAIPKRHVVDDHMFDGASPHGASLWLSDGVMRSPHLHAKSPPSQPSIACNHKTEMLNKSVVSVGLFGRLSCLLAPRRDVLETIDYVERCGMRYRYPLCPPPHDPPPPSFLFTQALPTLLTELNSLVEAIVLSDDISLFCGHSAKQLNRVVGEHYVPPYPGGHMTGFHQTQVWGSEANDLMEASFPKSTPAEIRLDDPHLMDVEIALDYPHLAMTAWPIAESISGHGLDYDRFRFLTADEDFVVPMGDQAEDESLQKILAFVDDSLGDEWRLYNTVVNPLSPWPSGLLRPPSRFSPLREVQMKVGLFAELRAAQQHGTITTSGFCGGQYFPLFAAQPNVVTGQLREIAARQYSRRLHKQLEELGAACLDLRLPPILRICLHEADTILDVVKRANALRNEKPFINLRRHLNDVACAGEPEKLLRYLRRLHEWIERSLKGFGDLPDASIGMGTVSASLSLLSAGKHVLAWRNPVVLVHRHLKSMLAESDTIGDLARVFLVERAVAGHAVKQTDLI